MKICLVAHLNDLSGANRSLLDLAVALIRQGQSVTVVIPRHGELENALIQNGVSYKVIYSGTWAGLIGQEKKWKKLYKLIINYFAEYKFYKYIVNEDFDIVHYNSIVYGVGARLLKKNGKPYIWHLREFPEELNLKFYNKRLVYDVVGNSTLMFGISKATYNVYSKVFDEARLKVIYNGLTFPSSHLNNERNFSFPEKITLVIVGAIYPGKGQLEAVRAVEYLYNHGMDNINLKVVGQVVDNQYMEEIEDFINVHSIRNIIEFCGYQSDVTDIRKSCDIALVCSKSEAFGRVTIEAMFNKQIVIGSNIGGTLELIEDGVNGFLYKQGDFMDLVKKIIYVIQNKKLSKQIVENAYSTATTKFSITETAAKVIDAYKAVNVKNNRERGLNDGY
jgi:L-malate glycosyltransferase